MYHFSVFSLHMRGSQNKDILRQQVHSHLERKNLSVEQIQEMDTSGQLDSVLTRKQKNALLLRVQPSTFKEIGAEMDISSQTARQYYQAATNKLRLQMRVAPKGVWKNHFSE